MDLLKKYITINGEVELEHGGCFHVIELTEDYVVLKECYEKHEIKYYFEKDETADLLFCDALHRLPNDERGNQGICAKFELKIEKSDILKSKKQTFDEKINIVKELLRLTKKYGFIEEYHSSDLWNIIDDTSGIDEIMRYAINKEISIKQAAQELKSKCDIKQESQMKCKHRFNDECLKFGDYCKFAKDIE